jgi:hypothetical protein
MAFNYSPKIVTDGLVLYLDAANSKSYVSGSTTWNDISRTGVNGALTNGPTFTNNNGGAIVFDGSNDYILSNSAINTGQNFTVDVWFKLTTSGRRALVSNSYLYTANTGWYFFIGGSGQTNNLALSVGTDQAYINTVANTLINNQWYNACGTVTNGGSSMQLYLNGAPLTPASSTLATISIAYTIPDYKIGRLAVSGFEDYYSGSIASTKIYNRALTAQEVLQNYNATKTRFGLT